MLGFRNVYICLVEMAISSNESVHADHQQVPTGKGPIDDSSSDEYSDGISDDDVRNRSNSVRVPLRNARRKSVMPSPSLKLNDSDLEDQSPHNSVTSINSLSSLLKEKLVMTFPGVLRKKRPREYKLRGFVAVLFLCIVFLVGFAYIFYHQQVLQRAYFDRIRFNKEERHVRVFNEQGQEILQGWLGTFLKDAPHFGFHEHNVAYPCLPRDAPTDGSLCLEWMHKARLYMRYQAIPPGGDGGEMRCYQIEWHSLSDEVNPTDCYDWSTDKGHWYGGGKTPGMAWPMELGGNLKERSSDGTFEPAKKGDVPEDGMAPFVTGDASGGLRSWGNVLNRYFINSRGVALSVDPNTPLYTSLEDAPAGGKVGKRFCLQARYDDFAFSHRTSPLPRLNYSICTASNVKTLHSFLSEKSLWDGLKKEDLDVINTMLNEPVWRLSDGPGSKQLTEQALIERAEGVVALGFLRQGHVVLGEGWQKHPGDFTLDHTRFPTMRDTINIIHRRGFRIALTISPFISTESESFQIAVRKGLLVAEQGGGAWHQSRNVPALTRYGNTASAGVLDVTNVNHTVPWLREKLRAIVDAYAIDSFYLDVGTAFDMPRFPRLEHPRPNLDSFKTAFLEAVLGGAAVLGMSGAVQRPRPPAFVSLPSAPSSWEALRAIIPTTLTYGVIGYPFIMPGAVGGDYDPNATEEVKLTTEVKTSEVTVETTTPTTVTISSGYDYNETDISSSVSPSDAVSEDISSVADSPAVSSATSTSTTSLPPFTSTTPQTTATSRTSLSPPPPRELYLRWLQLATFLPAVQHRLLPSQYEDDQLLEVARELASLRQKVVNPLLRRYAREALDSGLPLVRPLWMLDPTDISCHMVSDEFSIGEELIVAPVLREGAREREVYLPAGVWKDGIDSSLRKGDRWMHNYRVNEDKVAYFVKMPDNTRF
ncbi:hypothetical protein J437_LFUL000536 [Ladona fulva]|uniref:Uncharacterized protein n=1 Tax=Ladona fulva TaxID=123851 RepID=A0A8K0NSJ8_LADFU|nr:hypothetical protein J437_LFUL000536 [Ladona fulva]